MKETFYKEEFFFYTLRFTAKTYLFGPVSTATGDIIKTSRVSYLSGTDTTNTTRELSYTVTPRAIKNYTRNSSYKLIERHCCC